MTWDSSEVACSENVQPTSGRGIGNEKYSKGAGARRHNVGDNPERVAENDGRPSLFPFQVSGNNGKRFFRNARG